MPVLALDTATALTTVAVVSTAGEVLAEAVGDGADVDVHLTGCRGLFRLGGFVGFAVEQGLVAGTAGLASTAVLAQDATPTTLDRIEITGFGREESRMLAL